MRVFIKALATALLLNLCACAPKPAPSPETAPSPTSAPKPEAEPLAALTPTPKATHALLWDMQQGYFTRALDAALKLKTTTHQLLRAPSQDQLEATRARWEALQQPVEALQFLSLGQWLTSQNAALKQTLQKHHGRTAAWPIAPGTLDYFGPYLYSGLVHDIGLPIDAETLIAAHQKTSIEDVILGLYAIEFLLYGFDAARPLSDFLPTALSPELEQVGYTSAKELPNNRRRRLLKTQVQLMEKGLQDLKAFWLSDLSQQPLYQEALERADKQFISGLIKSLGTTKQLSTHEAPGNEGSGNETDEEKPASEETRESLPIDTAVYRIQYQLGGWCEAQMPRQQSAPEALARISKQCEQAKKLFSKLAQEPSDEQYTSAYNALKLLLP